MKWNPSVMSDQSNSLAAVDRTGLPLLSPKLDPLPLVLSHVSWQDRPISLTHTRYTSIFIRLADLGTCSRQTRMAQTWQTSSFSWTEELGVSETPLR